MKKSEIPTVDSYIAQFPTEHQKLLQSIRQVIRENAPRAVERISWAMPSYWQGRYIAHFAAQKNHIGLHIGADTIGHFRDKLYDYAVTKGAVRFRYTQKIPYEIIAEMIQFKVSLSIQEDKDMK